MFLISAQSLRYGEITRTVPGSNPLQLEAEIRSIDGFQKDGISVYILDSGASYVYIDDSKSPLTSKQIQDLDLTISRHIPDFSTRDQRAELEAIELKIEMDDATWDSLTNSQKLSVLKTILRREVLKKRLGE